MQPCSQTQASKTGSRTHQSGTLKLSPGYRFKIKNIQPSSSVPSLTRSKWGGGELSRPLLDTLAYDSFPSAALKHQSLSTLDHHGRLCPVPSLIRLPIHPSVQPAIPMLTSHAHAHAQPETPNPTWQIPYYPDLQMLRT